MRYTLSTPFLLISVSHICATSALAINSTHSPSLNQPSSLTKTEVICLTQPPYTTSASANAFIEELLRDPWMHIPTTWSQRIDTSPGHLPLGIAMLGTELTMFARGGTMEEETLVLADWTPVLRNIVKECIARGHSGGRAFVGDKGFLGVVLMGVS